MNHALPGKNDLGGGEASGIDEFDQFGRPGIDQRNDCGRAASVIRVGQRDPIGLFRPQGETDRDKPRAGGG